MNISKNMLAPLLCALLVFVPECGLTQVAGTSSETQTVVGKVAYIGGASVRNAKVVLHEQKPILSVIPIASTARETTTDDTGCFRFDSVKAGGYHIEVNSQDSAGALRDTAVKIHDIRDSIMRLPITIAPMGIIKGAIDTGLVSKTGSTWVYAVEVEKRVAVDSAGGFSIRLPPHEYSLRVLHDSLIIASFFDSATVKVYEGDTTRIQGIPSHVGEVKFTGGTLAGQTLDSSHWQVTVSPGAAISGSVTIQTNNTMIASAVAPFGYTWTWGRRDSAIAWVDSSLSTGIQTWTIPITQTAPPKPGTYYILFGFMGEYNLEQVFSCTNWTYGSVVWNDGNDFFDMNDAVLAAAHAKGYAAWWWVLFAGGVLNPFDVPVASVKIIVQ